MNNGQKKKKVGILTFHASHNYGSMLQAWALQTYLQQRGMDVMIINYRSYVQRKLFIDPLKWYVLRIAQNLICAPRIYIQNVKKWRLFERFMRENYRLSDICLEPKDIQRVVTESKLDVVVVGSDQIWNANCLDFSIAYYWPFNISGVKVISYAPSFGSTMNFGVPDYRSFMKSFLSNFDSLSVRDEAGSRFLTELMGYEVCSAPDPTLLLSKQSYLNLFASIPKVKGDYIFYYTPWQDDKMERFVLQLAKKYNLPIVSSADTTKYYGGMKYYQAVGPCEFLNLIYNAKYVCGYSFHLLVFSLLFHKNFVSIDGNKDARMASLLKMVGLETFGIPAETEISELDFENINWAKVDSEISEYQKVGYEYLAQSIGNE